MTEDELTSALRYEIQDAIGGDTDDSELSGDRADAWTFFLGEPFGNEIDGRSTFRTHDLAEVLDWVMPECVRAFASGEEAVTFASHGMDDEPQAELESKFINEIFFRENQGLLLLHNWIQETLLMKTGYLKVDWDDSPEVESMFLGPMPEEELLALEAAEGIQVESVQRDEMGFYGAEVIETKPSGKLKLVVVPSNEQLVCRDHTEISLKNARFSGHRREVTRSELIEMGFDKDEVYELPTNEKLDDEEDEARDIFAEDETDSEPQDKSQQKIMLTEGVWRVDADDDGIAERYLVYYAGSKILLMEKFNRTMTAAMTAMPLSNKHLGRSMFDKILQIQELKTALVRQVADNLFQMNNTRYAAVEGKVNIRELLNNKFGGVVRQKMPGMIEPLMVQPIGADAFNFLEYLDKIREERTGVGPEVVTELGQLANMTAWGTERLMAKKEELVGMIISLMRGTGINEAFELMHQVLREEATGPMEVKVDGKWVQQDPRQWRPRKAVPPVTWSGLGDKLAKQKTLQQIGMLQEKLLAGGEFSWMVSERHLYEVASDFIAASGLSCNEYMYDPASEEGQRAKMAWMQQQQQRAQQAQSAANVMTEIERVKGEYQQAMAQMKEISKREIEQMKADMTAQKEIANMMQARDNIEFKYAELQQRLSEKFTAIEADLIKAGQPRDLEQGAL